MALGTRNSRIAKHKFHIATVVLLFSLLAFPLQSIAMSFELQSRVIGSSGSVVYPSGGTLHVTDSTPEGPVPYTIDGQSGYDTGLNSYYTIPAGAHTIELPSPYTSPISNITYYFSYWQDGPTNNSRTVTLAVDETLSLHGIYSTSPEPPPPPPPPPNGTMPSDYIAYTGWESGTGIDDNRGLSWNWNLQSSTVTRDTSFRYAGTASIRTYKTGAAGRMEFKYYPSWGLELYQSYWIYIAGIHYWPGWWEFWSLREQSTLWNVLLRIDGSLENPKWYFSLGWTYGGTRPMAQWYYDIDQYGLVESKPWPGATVSYNAHGIPRDRWFRLEIYLYRHATNGIWKVWITDPQNPNPDRRATRLLFSFENGRTTTTNGPGPGESLQGLKQYGMAGTVYYDELYIYNYNAHGGA